MSSSVKTPATITVRPLEIDDIPSTQEIERKSTGRLRALTYEDPQSACIGGDFGISYVAEVEGTVVGFVFGWLMEASWFYHEDARIEMIGVDPDYRKHHVGRLLLDAFLKGCRESGVRRIHMQLDSRDKEFIAFFTKSGFRPAELVEYVRNVDAPTS